MPNSSILSPTYCSTVVIAEKTLKVIYAPAPILGDVLMTLELLSEEEGEETMELSFSLMWFCHLVQPRMEEEEARFRHGRSRLSD